MVFSLKRPFVIFILLLIGVGAVSLSMLPGNKKNLSVSPNFNPPETSNQFSVAADTSQPIVETDEIHSPDGKMTLIIETVKENEKSTYSFFVAEVPIGNRKLVFEKTLSVGSLMQASPNAWSPDNKYFFIKEKNSGSMNYFVFKQSGEAFGDEQAYIDVAPLFVAKNTGHELTDVTGWDSPTLLHLFTKTDSGERGPSYWFEVPSGAIIQLATH